MSCLAVVLLSTASAATAAAQASGKKKAGKRYAIHLSGVCSTTWSYDNGYDDLGAWEGIESIDAQVDQRNSMSQATADFKKTLDTYCRGNDWCYVFPYSNGGAVASRTLALYPGRFNIMWVLAASSNEGGSELSNYGSLSSKFGGCRLAGHVSPSDHRAGWNHNATDGNTFYMRAGNKCMAPWIQCMFLPGDDDGVVAFHSQGGMNDTYSSSNICTSATSRFDNHKPIGPCRGSKHNHTEMQAEGVCAVGGCP